jgi:hypothetical protein
MAKRFIDAANLPLTSEGFQEEREFDAAQAKSGGQLRRISTGFVLHAPGVIRHFSDSDDMRAHVFRGGNREFSSTAHSITRLHPLSPPQPENPPRPIPTSPWPHFDQSERAP